MTYQVGDIELLKPDDPTFPDLPSATGHALLLSDAAAKAHETAFIGAWDRDNGCDLVAIIYNSEVFTK